MAGFILLIFVATAVASARLLVLYLVNRPDPSAGQPVDIEDLRRSQPNGVQAEISYEYLPPLLSNVQGQLDRGLTDAQRDALVQRVNRLAPLQVTYGLYSVVHAGTPTDLTVVFLRIDEDFVRCRFQGPPALINAIRSSLRRIPSKACV